MQERPRPLDARDLEWLVSKKLKNLKVEGDWEEIFGKEVAQVNTSHFSDEIK